MDNRHTQNTNHFVWDYNLSNQEFIDILEGKLEIGRLVQDWAIIRLLEYGRYEDIIRFLGYQRVIDHWSEYGIVCAPGKEKGGLTSWLSGFLRTTRGYWDIKQ